MVDVRVIQKQCLEKTIGVAEAVNQIDESIGGITRVDFKEGTKFKITNHVAMFSLDCRGLNRKQTDLIHGMAVLAYFQAQTNGSLFPGEVHISPNASTKHHRAGIYQIRDQYAA